VGQVLSEAERLVNNGTKELLVISQDTSAYGVDMKYRTDFWNGKPVKTRMKELCQELGQLDAWVRLHYVYPYPHVDDIIPLMAENRILPYLDIPFQHASPSVLKAMKRPAHAEKVLSRIHRWREICPDITLRSTFIVGFPGETESDFQMLLDFLEEAQLDRVGAFPYSNVDGARSAALPNHVDEAVKQERFERFMAVQQRISAAKLQARVGKRIEVIVDEVVEEGAVARSKADAPDIDGQVFLDNQTQLKPGDRLWVEVEEADDYDLWAHPV
jgi:ribosomal protein S12 methylthiotransferase